MPLDSTVVTSCDHSIQRQVWPLSIGGRGCCVCPVEFGVLFNMVSFHASVEVVRFEIQWSSTFLVLRLHAAVNP